LSYAAEGILQNNITPLMTLRDSTPDLDLFPEALATNAGIATRPELFSGNTEVALGDWVLKDKIVDTTTGFSCLFLYSAEGNEYIVAMTGTNGPDAQDWYNNLNYSTTQWNSNQETVAGRFEQVLSANENRAAAHITFTGQSLGGALSQFAAYDFVERNPSLERRNLSIITFNGLGAFGGMRTLRADFSPERLAGAETAHYVVYNDIVSRLGDGNFNAPGNTYLLDFRALPGQERALHFVDAHRIESGFYRGFEWGSVSAVARDLGWASFSTAARPYDIDYLNVSEAQRLAATFGQLFNDGDHSVGESWARLIAGITHGLRTIPVGEIQEATFAFITHLRRAGPQSESLIWDAASVIAPLAIKAASSSPPAIQMSAFSLLAGIALDVGEDVAESAGDLRDRIARFLPAGEYDLDLAESIAKERDFAHSMFKALLGFKIADGTVLKGLSLEYDVSEALGATFRSATWLRDTLQLFTGYARDAGVSVASVATTLAEEIVSLAKGIGTSTSELVREVLGGVTEFIGDIGKAIANAHQDFITKIVDTVFDLRRALGFSEGKTLIDELKARLGTMGDADVREAIDDAVDTIESAGQTVLLNVDGPGSNPFDVPDFDPDSAPLPSERVQEGGIKRFTLSLPYGAGDDGQRIAITLGGNAASNVKLLANGEEVVAQDGVYTVVVKEGARELELSVLGQIEITESGTLAVSATLVDAAGQATHQTHVEATIGFVARNDRVFEGAPGLATDDNNTALNSYGGFPGSMGVSIDYLGGDDVVWGDVGDDRFLGGTGNDRLFGSFRLYFGANDRDWLSGGPGDDQLLGHEGDDILEGDSGSDLLLGDVGDDFLFGGSKADYETIFTVGGLDPEGDIVQGGAGKDLVVGSGGLDKLSGGNDADLIMGGAGNDEIRGDTEFIATHAFQIIGSTFPPMQPLAAGADVLYGNAGSDTLYGEGANDLLYGGEGNDTLIGGEGHDELYGGSGSDVLIADNDEISVSPQGNDFLDGGEGDDLLRGQGGADTLNAGAGNDRLEGGDGGDTYVFTAGDGQDIVVERGVSGFDVLTLDDYTRAAVTIARHANGSVRLIGANGDTITIVRMVGGGLGIESVQFADGTNLSAGELASLTIDEESIGGPGWETLTEGDDTVDTSDMPGIDPGGFVMVDAGPGNDTVHGGANAVVFGNDGDDMLIGGDALLGGRGNDSLSGGVTLIGGAGDDELRDGEILLGGPGSDFLDGGFGPDRYQFKADEPGLDTIADAHGLSRNELADWYYRSIGLGAWRSLLIDPNTEGSLSLEEGIQAGLLPPLPQIAANDYVALAALYAQGLIPQDTVEFGSGIVFEDLALDWGEAPVSLDPGEPGDLPHVTLGLSWGEDSAVRVVVPRTSDPLGSGIERFRFEDGTILSLANMIAAAPPAPDLNPLPIVAGTENPDLLIGSSEGDSISGLDGADDLHGGKGNDLIAGGGDSDILNGDEGENLLIGGLGDDTVDLQSSYSIVAFNAGEGEDTIYAANAFTLSVGGGVQLASLSLRKEGSELVLAIGSADAIRLNRQFEADPKNWREIKLQLIGGSNISTYDFSSAIDDFYGALDVDPLLTDFPLEAVLQSHLLESGTDRAIGGDLAYQYATQGNLDALARAHIRRVLANPGFGLVAQQLNEGEFLGTDSDDVLVGSAEADTFTGGPGNDLLDGCLGNDVYVFNTGDGADRIADAGGSDTLAFGEGITPDVLTLELGSLLIRVGEGGDAIHLESFDPNDVFGSRIIEFFQFSSGITLSYSELIARGFDIAGTGGDDVLHGTNVNDRMDGLAGDDLLVGGEGNDTYFVTTDSGSDYIEDSGGQDTVRFGEDIDPDEVIATLDGDTLTLDFEAGQLSIRWEPGQEHEIERFEFSDGTVLTVEDFALVAMVGTDGDDEIVGTDSADRIVGLGGYDSLYGEAGDDWLQGGADGDFLVGGSGNDALEGGGGDDGLVGGDGDDALDGGTGSDYLEGGTGNDVYVFGRGYGRDSIFDDEGTTDNLDTIRFNADIEPLDLVVTTDLYGALHLTLAGTPDRFTIYDWFTDEVFKIEALWFSDGTVWDTLKVESRIVPAVATSFGDVLSGSTGNDVLAGLGGDDNIYDSSGNDILSGDGGNDTLDDQGGRNYLSGGPGDDQLFASYATLLAGGAGNDYLAAYGQAIVIAFNRGDGLDTIDALGLTGGGRFTLSLGGGIRLADVSFSRDEFDLAISTGAGDSIRLGGWYFTDPAFRSGGVLQIIADDIRTFDFATAINAFDVANAQDPEIGEWAAQDALSGNPFAIDSSQAIGGNIAYHYGRFGSADGLSVLSIQATLGDPFFGLVAQSIVAAEEPENHAPVLANAVLDQTSAEDDPFVFTITEDTFTDSDAGDALTLTASREDGTTLPVWLLFDAGTRTFSGTPMNSDVGGLDVTLTATDPSGESASGTFRISVVNTNDAPDLYGSIADRSVLENTLFEMTISSGTFLDVDTDDSLTLGASLADGAPLPAWLSFNALSASFSGMPENGDVGSVSVRVVATDESGAQALDDFALTVVNVNDAPALGSAIADQAATSGTAFDFTIPANIFSDIDQGDILAYGATLASGDPLPGWLTFNTATRSFFGVPGASDVGTFSIRTTATDLAGATAFDDFQLTVAAEPKGVRLTGTPHDDVLIGTGFGDTLLGEGGDDRLYGDAGHDLLDGGRGEDRLYGDSGNDVLAGGKGDDRLEGGADGDVYVHELHGGADIIIESGGADILRFGEGITQRMTRLERHNDDLIVDLSGPHDGVTIKGWFTSNSKKVESIQFADGTTLRIADIREQAQRREQHDGGGNRGEDHGNHQEDRDEYHHGKSDGRRHDHQHDDRSDREGDRMADCLAAYLAHKPRYDFEALTQELERSDWRGEALEPREIARRWQMVDRYTSALSNEHDEDARGGAAYRLGDQGLLGGGAFGGAFGYTDSSSSIRGIVSLKTLQGLEEGFRPLRL
jgi:Ca2+-binding RTX toxin-like protein